jgi:uncharacterized protein
MTPQERQMVADLFDRLASLEGERRDPDAERVIREGLDRAPNAVYALVQSVLVQDEALKRANTRIEELERAAGSAPAQGGGGFLDSMRNVLTGRGSVPSVRPGGQGSSGQGPSGQGSSGQGSSGAWGPRPDAPPPGYPPQGGYQQQPGYPPGYQQGAPMGGGMMGGHGGGSFLGTAAATVAGVVGGAMLLNGIRSAFGAGGHQAFGGGLGSAPSPWGGSEGGALSRDAGVGDIGHRGDDDRLARQDAQQDAQQDLEDDDRADDAADDAADYADDGGGDFGGGGDSDGE